MNPLMNKQVLIDRLKEIVPVWKKEVGEDQSIWLEGSYHPTEADN